MTSLADPKVVVEGLEPGPSRRGESPGEYRCVGCGYGISVTALPEACPMCRSSRWEPLPALSARGERAERGQAA